MQAGNVRVHQYGTDTIALDVSHDDGTSTRLTIPHGIANAIADSIQELTTKAPANVRVYKLDATDSSIH